MNNSILDLFINKIEERKNSFIEVLSTGVSKDYAEYREMCGVIRGLATAQQEAADLKRKLKDIDDE
jgi:hypothetical protein